MKKEEFMLLHVEGEHEKRKKCGEKTNTIALKVVFMLPQPSTFSIKLTSAKQHFFLSLFFFRKLAQFEFEVIRNQK